MTEATKQKPYDLEERTFQFAKNVRLFIKTVPKTMSAIEDGKQVVRSSGSVGANYIEANESLRKNVGYSLGKLWSLKKYSLLYYRSETTNRKIQTTSNYLELQV